MRNSTRIEFRVEDAQAFLQALRALLRARRSISRARSGKSVQVSKAPLVPCLQAIKPLLSDAFRQCRELHLLRGSLRMAIEWHI